MVRKKKRNEDRKHIEETFRASEKREKSGWKVETKKKGGAVLEI